MWDFFFNLWICVRSGCLIVYKWYIIFILTISTVLGQILSFRTHLEEYVQFFSNLYPFDIKIFSSISSFSFLKISLFFLYILSNFLIYCLLPSYYSLQHPLSAVVVCFFSSAGRNFYRHIMHSSTVQALPLSLPYKILLRRISFIV